MKDYSFAINLPNADAHADDIRDAILEFGKRHSNNHSISIIEHFGKRNYFACLKYASLLIGNSSSGIIEAASFNKHVLNIGNRQKGRARGKNVVDCNIIFTSIAANVKKMISFGYYKGINIYKSEKSTASLIIDSIKKIYG